MSKAEFYAALGIAGLAYIAGLAALFHYDPWAHVERWRIRRRARAQKGWLL